MNCRDGKPAKLTGQILSSVYFFPGQSYRNFSKTRLHRFLAGGDHGSRCRPAPAIHCTWLQSAAPLRQAPPCALCACPQRRGRPRPAQAPSSRSSRDDWPGLPGAHLRHDAVTSRAVGEAQVAAGAWGCARCRGWCCSGGAGPSAATTSCFPEPSSSSCGSSGKSPSLPPGVRGRGPLTVAAACPRAGPRSSCAWRWLRAGPGVSLAPVAAPPRDRDTVPRAPWAAARPQDPLTRQLPRCLGCTQCVIQARPRADCTGCHPPFAFGTSEMSRRTGHT